MSNAGRLRERANWFCLPVIAIGVWLTGGSVTGASTVELAAAGRGHPWIHFDDGFPLQPDSAMESALMEDSGRPAAMATADFDGDGLDDLAVAYLTGERCWLAVYPANYRSVFPQGSSNPVLPFLAPSTLVSIPANCEAMEAGDFDGDTFNDLVFSRPGSPLLHLLPGDGLGGWGLPAIYRLSGNFAEMVAGEIHTPDEARDLVVAVDGVDGPRVEIYSSRRGALRALPEIVSLNQLPSSLALGRFDADRAVDLALIEGQRLTIVRGRSTEKPSEPLEIQRSVLGFEPIDIVAGRFLTGAYAPMDVALLARHGEIHFLTPGTTKGGTEGVRPSVVVPSALSRLRGDSGNPARLRKVRIGGGLLDDLLVIDPAGGGVFVYRGEDLSDPSTSIPVKFDSVAHVPQDILAMRLNRDRTDDLIVLPESGAGPLVVLSGPSAVFTVDSAISDAIDANPGDGICATALGICTLRAAVEEARLSSGSEMIQFSLGSGTPVIQLTSPLPVDGPVTIDGATGGADRIELRPSGPVQNGLEIQWSVLLRSMVVNGFGGTGIYLAAGASLNHIEDCYIGTDANGGSTRPGNYSGVKNDDKVAGFQNTIGGTSIAQRNVISNNSHAGVEPFVSVNEFYIRGNYIGTDPTGSIAVPNGIGVYVNADGSTLVGGPTAIPGEPPGNVVSGNNSQGIVVFGDAQSISGNLIGLAADGESPLGNGGVGIAFDIAGSVSNNVVSANAGHGISAGSFGGGLIAGNKIGISRDGSIPRPNIGSGIEVFGRSGQFQATVIGGAQALTPGECTGDCNLIANNLLGAGIRVAGNSHRITIRGNSVYANGGLGIDLGGNGVTQNDVGDADAGDNGLQNFPLITSAVFDGSETTLTGTLESTPSTVFDLDVYGSDVSDLSGFGEGQRWLASTSIGTDSVGQGPFAITVAGEPTYPSMTATDPNGNTSEFSQSFVNPGESNPAELRARRSTGTSVEVDYARACEALDHAIYFGSAGPGPIETALSWSGVACGLGTFGIAGFDPGDPSPGEFVYFVVVGQRIVTEGSYGRSSTGTERPESSGIGACDLPAGYDVSCQ